MNSQNDACEYRFLLTGEKKNVYTSFMSHNDSSLPEPDIGLCICSNLRRATRAVTQAYDAALRPAGIRASQFSMLALLKKRGELRQSTLADLIGLDGTTLTRNLQPLLKNEWIRIDRDEDQRVRLISLTAEGHRVVGLATPLWQGVQAHFVDSLGSEQWSALLDALNGTGAVARAD